MARDITPDDWPAHVTDVRISAVTGAAAFARGRRYAETRRVSNLSVSGNGEIIAAAVRGSRGRVYQTMVFSESKGRHIDWRGSCSCPVGSSCKHTAALILTARRRATAAAAPPGDADWESRLTNMLRTRQTSRRAVAIEISAQDSGARRAGRLGLLPLLAGKRGWVKQGISWRAVVSGDLEGQVSPEALDCLEDLASMDPDGCSYYYSSSRISLETLPARVWEVLRRGADAGVTLTTAQRGGNEVRILSGLRVGLGVRRRKDGTARISPSVDLSGVEGLATGGGRTPRPRPLGDPTHGYALTGNDGVLSLMPLEPPPGEVLGRILRRDERLTIPAADVERFESTHLGRLAAAVPIIDLDPAMHLPETGEPVAVLRVGVDAARHRAETAWSIRYVTPSGENRGEAAVDDITEVLDGPGPLDWSQWAGAPAGGASLAEAAAPATCDRAAEDRLARRIVNECLPLAQAHGPLWRHRTFEGMATARLVTRALPALEQIDGVVVEVTGEVPDYREAEEAPLITTDVAEDGERLDWFSLRVRVRVGDEEVPVDRLMTAVAAGAEEVLLDSGRWVNLANRPEIARLVRLMEEGRDLRDPEACGAGDLSVTPFQAGLYAELVRLGVVGEATQRWREGVERLLAVAAAAEAGDDGADGADAADDAGAVDGAEAGAALDVPVPAGLRATLRPYQFDGYRWLALLQSTGLGGVLADDMGLGKTVQVLAVVQRMMEGRVVGSAASAGPAASAGSAASAVVPGRRGPVLVVAPTSVVGAWVEQAARFCPDLRVRAVTRTRAKRDEELGEIVAGADMVVTSYTIARLEEDFVGVDWAWVVLDEAQFVKNHTAVTYKTVRSLRTPSTVAITGTPLENSLMDLWSLLSIAAPGLLPGPDRFAKVYRRPVEHGDDDALAALRARIRPFLLRRAKEDVAADLPDKSEQILSVELGAGHRRAYDRRLARERQKVLGLLEEDTAQARFTALKSLTILRQMALDPELVETPRGSAEPRRAAGGGGRRRRPTAKTEMLLETLRPVIAEGHRALVFSQFTRYLTRVREALEADGMRTAYLDGTTMNRQEAIDAFRAGRADVFLISLKAGGFGLTLTEADYVFLLDPWWNPQAEEQAVDRTHRIGQDKSVMVYRLVSAGTIEEKVMALKEKKAELFGRVVEGSADDVASAGAGGAVAGGAGAGGASRARLTAQEIRELIGGA